MTASRLRRARARHLLPVAGIAADRRVDPPSRLHLAPDERDVLLLDFAIVKLPRRAPRGRRRVFATTISPDVPRSSRCTMPGRFSPPMPLRSLDVVQQRVDERAGRMPRRRMDDHSRRLVDDDEVAVLVEDRERQRLGQRRRIDGLGTSTATSCPALTA